MVYLPMAYCYGKIFKKKKDFTFKCFFSFYLGARYVGPKTKLVEELRHELYDGIGGYEG